MFGKYDQQLAETAADTTRRAAAITDLSKRRDMLFWGACLASVGMIVSIFGGKPGEADGALAFLAALMWMLVFKFDSELRLMRVIDRLHRQDKELA